MQGVTIVDHPLVQHKLTLMREKELSTKSFRDLCPRDRHPALLRGHARSAARMDRDRDADDAHEGAEDRRQEAGVRADPARRPGPGRRHARPGAGRARRAHRPLPRSGDAGRGRILLEDASRPRRAPGHRGVAGGRHRQHRGRRDRPAEGARRKRHPRRLPDRLARGRRAAARHPSGREDLDRRRSTTASTTTPSSFPAWATPATAPTARNSARADADN